MLSFVPCQSAPIAPARRLGTAAHGIAAKGYDTKDDPPGPGGSLAPTRLPGSAFLRKEVIQPQVLLRLPCYDFTPVINSSLDACAPASRVGSTSSANVNSHGVTGGVYKARERIHRSVLMSDY